MQKEADKEAARKSIARMDILKSKVKEIDYGNSNHFNAKKKEIVNEIIKKELNADPNRLNSEQVKSAKTITNWVEDNLLKNSGTKFLSDFGYATTNDEKARLIVKMYKEKGEEKGREALRKLDQMGVISQDLKDKVNNELRK
jgi:transposase